MTAAPAQPPLEQLSGLVERVTFHNADSGFCVLRLKVRRERDLVTLVGHARGSRSERHTRRVRLCLR